MRKRNWIFTILCLIMLYGCVLKKPYDLASAKQTELTIASDEYYLPGKKLITLEKSEFEEQETLYYAKDELALAQIIQYAYERGETTIAYQSERKLDIDETAKLLSIVNPFDLSLIQNDTTYKNATKDVLYTAHHVEMKNLDLRYEEALDEASRRVSMIIDEHMSVNEKITAIHDDLIRSSVYDIESQKEENHNTSLFQAAGVLMDGTGVCTSYSRAFMMMAKAANIPAIYVSSEEMNHGWNYVFDGETWRYIDVTWDDPVPDQGDEVFDRFLHLSVNEFWEEGSHTMAAQEIAVVQLIAENFF